MVSIPVGFFQALQLFRVQLGLPTRRCFNPCRVFSGLATPIPQKLEYPSVGFNPCRVFSGLATQSYRVDGLTDPTVVSIPVGFFQALQQEEFKAKWWDILCFNPCRVFSGLATVTAHPCFRDERVVSIPVGFFQALQPGEPFRLGGHLLVSIPVGFFQALQRPPFLSGH